MQKGVKIPFNFTFLSASFLAPDLTGLTNRICRLAKSCNILNFTVYLDSFMVIESYSKPRFAFHFELIQQIVKRK